MKINNSISDSISEYTCHTDKSQIIKALINPINYLEGLKKSDHFSIINSFIYNENSLNKYLGYIKDMFTQGYYNYFNSPDSLHFVLYRAMSENEFNSLKINGYIDTFYSTFSTFAQARNYILDNYEDVFKDNHYIVEFKLCNSLPFIDVSTDSSNCYERGETILLPSFYISDLNVIENQHYYHTIYDAKAVISPIKNEIYDIEDLYVKSNNLYIDIIEGLYKNGNLINTYLKDRIQIKDNEEFIDWAKKLSLYIKYLSIIQEYNESMPNNKILKKKI